MEWSESRLTMVRDPFTRWAYWAHGRGLAVSGGEPRIRTGFQPGSHGDDVLPRWLAASQAEGSVGVWWDRRFRLSSVYVSPKTTCFSVQTRFKPKGREMGLAASYDSGWCDPRDCSRSVMILFASGLPSGPCTSFNVKVKVLFLDSKCAFTCRVRLPLSSGRRGSGRMSGAHCLTELKSISIIAETSFFGSSVTVMALIPGRGRLRKEYARYSLTARSGISNPIFCSAILPSRSNRASEARRSAICMAPCVDSPDVGAMTGTGAAAACILGAAGAVTGVAGATTGAWAEVPE